MRSRWNLREDVALQELPAPERVVEERPPPPVRTPREWVRANLFSSPFNTGLTVVTGLLTVWLGYRILRWVLVTAEWQVIKANFRLYMIGRFPLDEVWRVWVSLSYVILLAGLSWGITVRPVPWTLRRIAGRVALAALVLGLLVYLVDSVRVWGLIGLLVLLFAGGGAVGRRFRESRRLRRTALVGWFLAFPFILLSLLAFDGVPPLRWGGFLLNVLVAVVAIVASFPIGLFLALGRRSTLPAISLFCVGVIEFVRGAPLYTWLLFGEFLLPFLLPPGVRLPSIFRAMIMFTVFSSAYVAEIVRGGLQGVHQGQFEAARALGLSTTRMMGFIILPQALRNTIPAMISHFISLFKDTSLLAVIGFIDTLRVARRASAALEFQLTSKQTLLFAALLFWMVAYAMSRWSQRLERRLGVGER